MFDMESSVVDVEETGRMLLQDILAMTEPERTYRLRAWVEYSQYADDGGLVKIGTEDGTPTRIVHNKDREFNIPPRGRLVSREAALTLLREYGENGQYLGRDRATGLTEDAWEILQQTEPEIARRFRNTNFNFNQKKLIQIPRGSEEVVEEASSKE